ncbi:MULTISPECIES: DUF4920 domain-containing protein [unclassified Pseudoalteromonas]|uniref:DUF4920 domain-containing protein n=1 Tax=unclassified Pseudoalteromonas TaxID=194690 RepID=UPI0009E2E6D5|nr:MULTISPECIES: DUF4920 domain-containing protein [unclassified Pseudoalteromonas]
MKFLVFKTIMFLMILTFSYDCLAKSTQFGGGADMSKQINISDMLNSPEKYKNEVATITGSIVKVCKKRGCWMELASDKKYQTLTIKVPDGKMVFPMSAMGKTAFATGTLNSMKLNLAKTRDYLAHKAKENQTEFDPSTITQAMTVYRFSPIGVTIVD